MADRELLELGRGLDAVPDVAARTKRRLTDLHSLAFDRHVGESVGGGSGRSEWYLDEVGKAAAKDVWRRLRKAVHAALVELEAASVEAGKLLSGGPGPDPKMRGTFLGDDGPASAKTELNELLEAQARRQARERPLGEYEATRAEPQPKLGGK